MASGSSIEWTESTWNPVTGCTKISADCAHCYAERMARRLHAMGQANYRNGFKVTYHWRGFLDTGPDRETEPGCHAVVGARVQENQPRVFRRAPATVRKARSRMSARTAILFATPGTTCAAARGVYDQIARATALRFPDAPPRWCYTSGPVRRKLAAQGIPAPAPAAALCALQAEGFDRVAVMPLHLSDGMEFRELAGQVAAATRRPGTSLQAAMGGALLTSDADWHRTLAVLLASLPQTPGPHGRVILVAHGSQDPEGSQTLARAAHLCRTVDPRLMLGMLLGKPGRDDIVRTCCADGVKKVWLLPCMVVAGYSARDTIAGVGDASWAGALRRAGIETVPLIRGLGEVAGIVALWLDHVACLLKELAANGEKEVR